MSKTSKDTLIIIIELVVVTLIVLFVLNIDKIFPTPRLPTLPTTPISSNLNLSAVNGTVLMLAFSDFECPFCAAASTTVEELRQVYGDKLDVQFKHFPIHSNSKQAAEGAECARDQGQFWQYHDKLFANQMNLDIPSLKNYAEQLGLNTTAFNSCLDSGAKGAIVDADQQEGIRLGVQGTPTFLIDGQQIVGAQPISEFQKVIDAELANIRNH